VNVFDLDRALIRDYEHFARSFTQIRAPDIRSQVESIYASDRFWPEPLISINPRFERGASINKLADAGTLHEATARVFSDDSKLSELRRTCSGMITPKLHVNADRQMLDMAKCLN
jgi:hypothetical protein